MDHLQAIRIFARVVETGGFARAASSLQMPNATVSKWVKSLETHLGVKLLERSTRSVIVTIDGATYYERTRHLLAELDDIESSLGRAQSSPRGTLRSRYRGAVASAILIPALPTFRARYAEIQVQLSATDQTVDLVAENIDCAIRVTGDDPNLVTLSIGRLGWTTCASPSYLARHGTPQHPNEIVNRKMPVAGYFSASTGLTQPLQFGTGDDALTLEGVHYEVLVNESNSHLATALAGLGIIHTLDFLVRKSIDQGELVPILINWRPEPRQVFGLSAEQALQHQNRVFVDWVTAVFGSL